MRPVGTEVSEPAALTAGCWTFDREFLEQAVLRGTKVEKFPLYNRGGGQNVSGGFHILTCTKYHTVFLNGVAEDQTFH